MKHLFIIMFSLFNLFSQTACSQQPRIEWHGFEFNAHEDSPNVDVLEYQYGSSEAQGTADSVERSNYIYGHNTPRVNQTHVFGDTPVGEFLYVKWRNNTTQKIHEDKIDLRKRLPDDLYGKTIYFLIDNNQVYVYLIPDWDQKTKKGYLPEGKPKNGPGYAATFLDIQTIYPDNDPPKVRGGKQ